MTTPVDDQEDWALRAPTYRAQRIKTTIGAMLMMVAFSIVLNGIGILVPSGMEHFQVPLSAYAVQFSILGIIGALTMPLIGRAARRFGVRVPLIVASVWSAVWILAVSFSQNLTQMIIFTFLWAIGWSFTTLLPATLLISFWHHPSRRGFWQGTLLAAGGAGGVVAGFLLPALIPVLGWSGTMQFFAGVVVALMTVSGVFLVKNPPGLVLPRLAESAESVVQRPKVSIIRAGLLFPVILLVVASLLLSMEGGMLGLGASVYISKGLTLTEAGALFSAISLIQVAVAPLGGWVYDRFNIRGAVILLAVAYVVGFGGLILLDGFLGLLLIVPFIGVALINVGVMLPQFSSRTVGVDLFPATYGVVLMVYYLGASIVAPLWGLGFDLTGSFDLVLLVAIVAGIIALVLIPVAIRLGAARRQAAEESTPAAVEAATVAEPI